MYPMSKTSERRKRIRVPLEKMIRHSRYQVLGTPVFEESSAVNLSSNGIAFETVHEYKKGALVLLEVEMSEELVKLLICVARVKRSSAHPDRFEVGGELIAIDPEHKKKMQTLLTRMIRTVSNQKRKPKAKKTKKKVAKKLLKKKSTKKKPVKKAAKKKSR